MPLPISKNLLTDSDLEDAQHVAAFLCRPAPRPPRRNRHPDRERGLKEVAMLLGVSSQAVSQVELRALRKCRAWCAEQGLRIEDVLR